MLSVMLGGTWIISLGGGGGFDYITMFHVLFMGGCFCGQFFHFCCYCHCFYFSLFVGFYLFCWLCCVCCLFYVCWYVDGKLFLRLLNSFFVSTFDVFDSYVAIGLGCFHWCLFFCVHCDFWRKVLLQSIISILSMLSHIFLFMVFHLYILIGIGLLSWHVFVHWFSVFSFLVGGSYTYNNIVIAYFIVLDVLLLVGYFCGRCLFIFLIFDICHCFLCSCFVQCHFFGWYCWYCCFWCFRDVCCVVGRHIFLLSLLLHLFILFLFF